MFELLATRGNPLFHSKQLPYVTNPFEKRLAELPHWLEYSILSQKFRALMISQLWQQSASASAFLACESSGNKLILWSKGTNYFGAKKGSKNLLVYRENRGCVATIDRADFHGKSMILSFNPYAIYDVVCAH